MATETLCAPLHTSIKAVLPIVSTQEEFKILCHLIAHTTVLKDHEEIAILFTQKGKGLDVENHILQHVWDSLIEQKNLMKKKAGVRVDGLNGPAIG